jgi:hypothetical protein
VVNLTKSSEVTEEPPASCSPSADEEMVDLHWEVTVEYSAPDARSLLNRLRWLMWNMVRVGNPPAMTKIATASEVTTVTADGVPSQMQWPNRRLLKVEPHPSQKNESSRPSHRL